METPRLDSSQYAPLQLGCPQLSASFTVQPSPLLRDVIAWLPVIRLLWERERRVGPCARLLAEVNKGAK